MERRFEALLAELRQQMPDEASSVRLAVAFRRHWSAPPLAQLELLLRRTTSLHEARLLLFFPEPVDMLTYVSLIQPPPRGAPKEHPQSKVRAPFIALLYMRHVRSFPLMRSFILEGGLSALASLFDDDNMYLRAQAIDTMMQLTSTELYDWFSEPVREPAVHRRWLDLAVPEIRFVQRIEPNLDSSFPGGSFYCLQILAFWLSLIRYFYCEGRVLRLGSKLMALLRRWAAHESAQGEERELAQTLVDDFSRFPTVEAMEGQLIGAAGAVNSPAEVDAQAPPPTSATAAADSGTDSSQVAQAAASSPPRTGDSPTAAAASYASPAATASDRGEGSEGDGEVLPGTDVSVDGLAAIGPPGSAATGSATLAARGGEVGTDGRALCSSGAEEAAAASHGGADTLLLTKSEEAGVRRQQTQPAEPSSPERAAALKKQGNNFFGAGDMRPAIECYTQALQLCPAREKHLILGNRSAAQLKLAQSGESEAAQLVRAAAEDARESVRLQPDFVKGYYRLGNALLQAGETAKAVNAIESGLKQAPYNDELRASLRSARAHQEQLRREELRALKQETTHTAVGASIDYQQAAVTAARAAEIARTRQSEVAPKRTFGSSGTSFSHSKETKSQTSLPSAGASPAIAWNPPASAQQFEREWSELRRSKGLAEQRAWLAQIPAAQYPAIFRESLSEETLCSVLHHAHESLLSLKDDDAAAEEAASVVLQALAGLANTRRFDMLLLFLAPADKQTLKKVFEELSRKGTRAPDEVLAKWGVQ